MKHHGLPNRTQRITADWLLHSGLTGDELLLEALLRRGFLAFRDTQGVWLGTGSHPADLEVLGLIDGLTVEAIAGHPHQMARVQIQTGQLVEMEVALAIVGLPENNGRMTAAGLGDATWARYKRMAWGAQLPVCPMKEKQQQEVNSALDMGIALLVKALPLARVATAISCDGHGIKPAYIGFNFEWDVHWSNAVFDVLELEQLNSIWMVSRDHMMIHIAPPCVSINESGFQGIPEDGFNDAEILAMLDDIQWVARRLLNQDVIDKIGRARAKTLDSGYSPPRLEIFVGNAQRHLAEEFGAPSIWQQGTQCVP